MGEFLAAFFAPPTQDFAAVLGLHPVPETVLFLGSPLIRLVCPFRHMRYLIYYLMIAYSKITLLFVRVNLQKIRRRPGYPLIFNIF